MDTIQKAFLDSFTLKVEDKTGAYPRLSKNLPVFVKELTADDFNLIRKSGGTLSVDDNGTRSLDLSTVKGGDTLIVSLGLCSDINGTLMFKGAKGKTMLGKVPTDILQPIARDIRKLSGLLTEDNEPVEDLLDEVKKS